ncbi:MAG: hypothetical protein ACJAWW_001561 [Sulfurimonas sp.]|jgi:hypothetical protein
MKKLNQEMKYISKIIEIFSKKENEKEMQECNIRLILLKNNQVVLSHMLDDLHSLIIKNQDKINDYYNCGIKTGSEFHIYELIDLFNDKTIGDEYNKDINCKNSSSNDDDDNNNENFDDEVRLMLIENSELLISKKFSELPELFRAAYINNIKLEVENLMEKDGGFVCIKEYEHWLTEISKHEIEISTINKEAFILLQELNKIKM